MKRRHGIFECSICRAQLRVKPYPGTKRSHAKLTTFAPKDHIGRWIYTPKNDEFVHSHGRMGVFKTEFVEDFEHEGEGSGKDNEGSAGSD